MRAIASARSVVLVCAVGFLFALFGAAKARAADEAGQQWALLIGVEGYTQAPPLRYTVNDVVQLATTLNQRGGYPSEGILQITDTAEDPALRPTRENLMQQIPRWLAQPGPEDRIIVYFSGHGFRDSQGRMFLAPLDCAASDPAATGIPVEWFREQLAACRAGFKLLLLDACHAGSEKGDEPQGVITAKDLGEPFRDLAGVVTLASSTGDQKSQLWDEKQQSLFSYWLNQGLKGHADENSDGDIDIDELNKYVHRNVTHTATKRFNREQTPVRIVRSGTPGVPVALTLQPQTLDQVISDIADQLSWALEERKLNKVGVLEFTNDTKLGELLGADFGLLGRYCAEELEQRLMKLGAGQYDVVDRRRLQKALADQRMSIEELGSPDALRGLSARAGGMPVIALGTLRNRAGRVVNLNCKLLQTTDDALAGTTGGTAFLDESQWAMLGRSVAVDPDDRRPPLPGTERPGQTMTDVVIARLDQRAEGAHPMADPKFPYRVSVSVGGRPRKAVFKGNDMLVSLRKGETYAIDVENQSGNVVLMRLLVDGLNTLPEKMQDKGVMTYEVAPRVSLDKARGWVLDPAQAKKFAVRGFVTETGSAGKLREFRVVDAAESVAARQEFTDQIGLITAAFYSPGGARSVGTGLGEERDEDLTERRDQTVGDLLAVVHIRYVDADAPPQGN